MQTKDAADGCRLTGAVGPEEAEDLSCLDGEVDLGDPATATEELGEALELNWPRRSRRRG